MILRCLLLLFGIVLAFASTGQAATIETANDGSVARLVVEWAVPVTVSTDGRGETFEIRASSPFPPQAQAQLAVLQPLVTRARLDETATTLTLHPAPNVQVETASMDNRSLVITATSSDLPTLGLRLGQHSDFERIVIEPVAERSVQLRQNGSRVSVTLPGRLAAADRDRVKQIAGLARVETVGDQLLLDLVPEAFLKDLFVEPDRQVIDVYVASPAASNETLSSRNRATALADASAANIEVAGAHPLAIAASDPAPDPSPVAQEPDVEQALREPTRAPAPWTPPSFSTLAIDATEQDDTLELRLAWPEPVPAAVFVRGYQLWVAFAAEHGGIVLDDERFRDTARRFVTRLQEEPHPEATLIRFGLVDPADVDVAREGGDWSVRLTRSGVESDGIRPNPSLQLRATPDGGLSLPDLDAMTTLTDPVIGDTIGIGMALAATGPTADTARFVGLRVEQAAQGAIWRHLGDVVDEPSWTDAGLHLGLGEGVVRADATRPPPVLPAPLLESLPMALDAPLESAKRPADAAPDHAAEGQTETSAETAELESTDQAPAAERASPPDESTIPVSPHAVVGETGSVRQPEAASLREAAVAEVGPLDLARLRSGPGRGFWEQRNRLLRAAETEDREDASVVTLELARLSIANGLGPEAVSVLATLPEPGPLDGPSTEWRALNGAAHFLAGRHTEALEHLAHSALRSDSESALWRGATLAALERWDEALVEWRAGQEWLGGYEAVNQAALAEPGIMLLLQTGRIDEAFALLDQLASVTLPAAAHERFSELEATALARDGALDEARTIWRRLAADGSSEIRSRAIVSLTLSDLDTGRMEADDAIDLLVADSVHWRGQSDEVVKRRRLADVQQEAGYVEDALATLQQALSSNPSAELTASVAEDMTAIIEVLFDELAAGERGATETLFLYRRYAELLPPGPDGDTRVKALAEALGELGFDDAAADSLRLRLAQSEERTAGRAALGYTLARVLARRNDRRGAMAALVESTPIEVIDDRLMEARRALFAEIGRAGDVRQEGADRSAAMLREQARTAFDREAWPEVLAFTDLLQPDLVTAGRLDSATTEIILMAATAARQIGDYPAVERLVATYGDRLAGTTDDAVLQLLAGSARFEGNAAEVLSKATDYVLTMREAVAEMPAL